MNLKEKEDYIENLRERSKEKGYVILSRCQDIPNFPFKDFSSLVKAYERLEMTLTRFNNSHVPFIYRLFASKAERIQMSFFSYLLFASFIVFFIGPFLVSWWSLPIGFLLFLIATSYTKKIYNRLVFKTSLESEVLFCAMYSLGQISIKTVEGEHIYFLQDHF